MPSLINNKRNLVLIGLIFLLSSTINSVLGLHLSGHQEPITAQAYQHQFNAQNAYQHIGTQLDFGYRVPGYTAHDQCADWIRNQMESKTEQVITHQFTKDGIECENILAKINIQKSNIVILGAHWDSRAVAEKDPDPENQDDPIPGANDGASGVAVLIELARIFETIKVNISCQVWFLFLDAEDQGESLGVYGIDGWSWCEGSRAFNNVIDQYYDGPAETIESFVLLDMVGGTNLQFIRESGYTDDDLYDQIWFVGRDLGYTTEFPSDYASYRIIDDHVYFHQNGIPAADLIIDFSSGNPRWNHHHRQTDDLSNIAQSSLDATGKTMESYFNVFYNSEAPPPNYPNNTGGWETWQYILVIGGGTVAVVAIGISILNKIQMKKLLPAQD